MEHPFWQVVHPLSPHSTVGKDVLLLAMKHQADVADKPSPPYHPASLQSLLGVPTNPSQQDRKPLPKRKQIDFDFSSNLHHIVCTHKINYRTYNAQRADPTMSSLVDRELMVVLLVVMSISIAYLIEK